MNGQLELAAGVEAGGEHGRVTAQDRRRALELLTAVSSSDALHVTVHEGNPHPKERPQFVRRGRSVRAITPEKSRAAEEAVAETLAPLPTFTGNVAVACIFYRDSMGTADVDNLLKTVLDGATQGAVWKDDRQVTACVAILELDRKRPRTVIAFGHHVSSMTRGVDAWPVCATCTRQFEPTGRRYCSDECRNKRPLRLVT